MKILLSTVVLFISVIEVPVSLAESASQRQEIRICISPRAKVSVGWDALGHVIVSARLRVGASPTTTLSRIVRVPDFSSPYSRVRSLTTTAFHANVVRATLPMDRALHALFIPVEPGGVSTAQLLTQADRFGFSLRFARDTPDYAPDEARMLYVLSTP
jgi:hypothetical protein